jgi:hypothetical protein
MCVMAVLIDCARSGDTSQRVSPILSLAIPYTQLSKTFSKWYIYNFICRVVQFFRFQIISGHPKTRVTIFSVIAVEAEKKWFRRDVTRKFNILTGLPAADWLTIESCCAVLCCADHWSANNTKRFRFFSYVLYQLDSLSFSRRQTTFEIKRVYPHTQHTQRDGSVQTNITQISYCAAHHIRSHHISLIWKWFSFTFFLFLRLVFVFDDCITIR